ncbi:pimeloyl-ACP methyl ester carboxylesterase [Paraburkholderia unamae]|uniref:alpha/beta fold hydrolase n=1 Tax=Paraburkholderia unamae TaxID=219649 RepID=UPI000DC2C39E|nr:alpha/beta hydrolase [Paraburkholderia unamae]RAR59203.1 pimeloyl-ACP methyl ester carboxylesterase [Paraburkholderia unamae]
MAPTLFLHGGPGLSSFAERELYGRTLAIHWWDQPRSVVMFTHPFGALVEAAEDEVKTLVRATGAPVDLVAHSFGAHIVLRLISRMPDEIGNVWLIAPIHDIGAAFVRLATRLLQHSPSLEQLLAALLDFKAQRDHARFARLSAQVMSFANFFDLYWSARADARRVWYLDLIARHSVVDANAFEVILRDFWAEAPVSLPLPATSAGPKAVQVVFGRDDPSIELEAERAAWLRLFPLATCTEISAGHFVHLETPASLWWRTA